MYLYQSLPLNVWFIQFLSGQQNSEVHVKKVRVKKTEYILACVGL